MALVLMAGFVLAACSQDKEHSEPVFQDAWVRPVPPGMKMTAGFGTLRNPGSEDLVLTSFSSPSFSDVSLHRTERVDGVSKMREVHELPVPPGESVKLEPGGYHLMLMMPATEVVPGQVITLSMTASGGQSFRFDVPVERR
jgi:copper(I)-binding protein